MPCPQYENLIMAYEENSLSAIERGEVETHLARCDGCRSFWGDVKRLEERLAAPIARPALSASFSERLLRSLDTETVGASVARRERSKRLIEAEYRANSAQLRRAFLRLHLPRLLDVFSYGVAAALLAFGLSSVAVGLPDITVQIGGGFTVPSTQVLLWGTGAIAFGSGTWSVSVPSLRAALARALLRESGEGSGVVSGAAGLGGNQLATLKFVLVALVLPVVALVLFLIVNDAVSS